MCQATSRRGDHGMSAVAVVTHAAIPPGPSNGDPPHNSEHHIRGETRNSRAQRVKTLAHEIVHALLHEQFGSLALAELKAEFTGFVGCQALGIDSSDYSVGYVATWAGVGGLAARPRGATRR